VALEEFDCVVLGDEPAGLWVLNQLGRLGVSGPIAWITFGAASRGTAVPTRLASHFQLTIGDPWSLEIYSPHETLLWDSKTLESRFPGLHLNEFQFISPKGAITPSRRDLEKLTQLIARYPELYTYSAGIWKFIGRTEQMHTQSMVWGALMCTEMATWHPAAEVATGVVRRILPFDSKDCVEKLSKVKGNGLLLKMRDQEPLLTKKLILNTSLGNLVTISEKSADLIRFLNVDELEVNRKIGSPMALYPLKLKVKSQAIPAPVRPLTFYFETSDIPDVQEEVWPIQRLDLADGHCELVVWVSALKEISLEALAEKFCGAMKRLHRLFPFLASALLEIDGPLSVECGVSDERRSALQTKLELSAIELYGRTGLDTRTRLKNVSVLSPFIHCELPYPLGPLQQAQKVLTDLFVGKSAPVPAAESPATGPTP
jgi:hypothetical protein